jgi:L-amino acid N-acyltransferase YncA
MALIRSATEADSQALAEIYNQGIEDRIATFEAEPRTADERRHWLSQHDRRHPVLIAEEGGEVAAWASLSAYSQRSCYSGVGELSIYVRRDFRGRGLGTELLRSIIGEAGGLGYWKLISRIFTFNEASRRLCSRMGFREVGILEKHGKLDGRWIDVVEVERLIPGNLR